jgi:hypothetical protein
MVAVGNLETIIGRSRADEECMIDSLNAALYLFSMRTANCLTECDYSYGVTRPLLYEKNSPKAEVCDVLHISYVPLFFPLVTTS